MPIFHRHHPPPFNLFNSLMSHKLSSQVLATSSPSPTIFRKTMPAEQRTQREEEAVGDLEDDSEDEEEEDCGEDEEVLGSEDDDEDLDRRRQRRMKVAMMKMMRRMRKMDDEEEEDDEGEEVMTEEQEMEQGKRMFSIFAPRRPRCGSSRTKTRSLKKREVKKQNANQETNDKRKCVPVRYIFFSSMLISSQQKLAKESEKARRDARNPPPKRPPKPNKLLPKRNSEFEKAKKEEEKRKRKEEEKKRIEGREGTREGTGEKGYILILNVRAMSEQLQTTGKCKHDKFLPLNEPPLRRGVVDRTCFHVTPVYYLGWYIPGDEIPDYYPEAGGEMPTFWTKEVMIPWVRDYDAKYKSHERIGICNWNKGTTSFGLHFQQPYPRVH
ncbi:hypothetical protein F5877DRAFT_72997 [Lentinula edodes]|nr:hypothetical protein F5877DRAFT_72997 [Lentinula edodes]